MFRLAVVSVCAGAIAISCDRSQELGSDAPPSPGASSASSRPATTQIAISIRLNDVDQIEDHISEARVRFKMLSTDDTAFFHGLTSVQQLKLIKMKETLDDQQKRLQSGPPEQRRELDRLYNQFILDGMSLLNEEQRASIELEIRRDKDRRAAQKRLVVAKSEISRLETALDAFEIDNGRFPTTEEGLDALLQRPATLSTDARRSTWNGPYSRAVSTKDPWGNPYMYRRPGKYNSAGFDLWSLGPDGIDGSGDEIINWQR